jgi:predicted transcriptional regulator of viral defense system
MQMNTRTQQIKDIISEKGSVRPRDLIIKEIPHSYLQRMYNRGELIRSGRGTYILAETSITQEFLFAELCRRIPNGVLCLLTALRFHEIGTQEPGNVWMAIDFKARKPRIPYPPVEIVRFSNAALTEGIEQHSSSYGPIRVYSPAKTVADSFKYRNKIGLDVAIEALRECRREKKATMDEIWDFAKMLRVANVMRPYMESLA